MTRRRAMAALALTGALAFAGCAAGTAPEPQESASSPVPEESVEAPSRGVIASDLQAPWSIAFHGQTPLVSERDSARILELDGQGAAREVARIEGVVPGGEGGLLGIAVRGDELYAYYTAAAGNRVERFAILGAPGALRLGEAREVLAGIPAARTHNGGRIALGPDGMLYVTTGDAGDRGAAQDLDALAGKILRLTPEGTVPSDNPFAGSLVYSYGHRNPQGIAWDEEGVLYASEFGQDTWDELNVVEPGGNYGWPEVEGIAGDARYLDPVQQWAPSEASPSGIAIADGRLYIANLRGARLREVPLDVPAQAIEHHVGEHGRLRDVVVAPDGALWVLTNNTDGRGSPDAGDDRIIALAPGAHG